MKIIFAIVLILCGLTVYKFADLEISMLNNGFSWTMSKILPYLALAAGGIILAYSFAKSFKIKSKAIKFVTVLILFAAPFAIGFALNPIYEGDFSSEGKKVESTSLKTDEKSGLMVITIPDCPYCLGSIGKLKLIKKRNPDMKILFSVCTTSAQKMSLYKEAITGDFDIELAENEQESVKLAEGSFPAFVQLKKGIPVYKWSNDQFGAGATDKLEGEIK